MKKIILLLNVLLFAFCSCSSDNNEDEKVDIINSTLLKRKEVYTPDGKIAQTYKYFYNGNKILSEEMIQNGNDDGKVITEFTYTGNLITNIKRNYFSISYNAQISNTDYVYNNKENLISSIKTNQYGYKRKIFYEKKSDKLISCVGYSIYPDNYEFLLMEFNLFFDINGNLIKSESLQDYGLLASYEYNTSLNSEKNVVGLNKILFYDFSINFETNITAFYSGKFNNITKVNPGYDFYKPTKYDYILNENGFPLESIVYINKNGIFIKDVTTKYFYE